MIPTNPPIIEKAIRILALGDSYTSGTNVIKTQSWPIKLKNGLVAEGYATEDPFIVAQNGWTTSDLLAATMAIKPEGVFDLVTLLIGVNNQFRGGDFDTYQTEIRTILGLSANFTGGYPSKILVLSIPDWGGTPFNQNRDPIQISAEIDQFNIINRRECLAAGSQYLDITPLSRLAANDPTMLASDGLHPSGKMYALWVKSMLPTILQILQFS
jgi:lysophospholipase L1-like esterase